MIKKNSLFWAFAFTLSLFSYSFQAFTKTVVISDIDDTLKKANSMGKPMEQVYHFLKKVPYLEMRDLFNEIKEDRLAKNEVTHFYYVSAALDITFNAQKWLQKYYFPLGRSDLRTTKNKMTTYDFKHEVIKNILLNEVAILLPGEPLDILMFGDNAQIDDLVYSDLTRELNLHSQIYIRDVRAQATFFDESLEIKKISGVNYYFSEVELFKFAEFNYLSAGLIARTFESYKNRTLIPDYTLLTLRRRLEGMSHDKISAKEDSRKYWNDYYLRY